MKLSNEEKKMKLVCLLCGRDKFTRRTPHKCVGGYRKRKIVWALVVDGIVWRFKRKQKSTSPHIDLGIAISKNEVKC